MTAIQKETLRIDEFMKLSDAAKLGYVQRTYPCGRDQKNEMWEYDFGVFEDHGCEICGKEHLKVYGTSDEREPKFCAECFVGISVDTDFVKEAA